MTSELTRILFIAITVSLGTLWGLATWFCFRRLRQGFSAGSGGLLSGELLVPTADAEALSRQVARSLAECGQRGRGGLACVRITERTAAGIRFEKVGQTWTCPVFRTGHVALEPQGREMRVRYEVSLAEEQRTFRLIAWLVCFGYGGLFVLGVPLLIGWLVLPSDDPAVRAQVFQTIQMVHGVWPPFLVGALLGRSRRATQLLLTNLFENLRFLV